MSECVVRMEMPENCPCCPMCYTADVQGYHWCAALEQEVEEGLSRPKGCPIICSLPEGHGRLVDEKSVRWAIDDIVLEIAQRTGRVEMTKDETMEYVNRLYTIVPAERNKT